MSVVPPMNIDGNEDTVYYSKEFPFVGSDETRSRYTKKLNELLKTGCENNGITYIDTYKEYSDDQGFLIKEFSDDNVHIMNRDRAYKLLFDLNILQ